MNSHHPTSVPRQRVTRPDVPFVEPLGVESLVGLRTEVAELREALLRRAPLEQAKGMLMLTYRIDEAQALRMIGVWSAEWDVEVSTVAVSMVRTASTRSGDVRRAVANQGS